MAKLLLLTNSRHSSAEVLPSLALLQHQVRILPAEVSVLVDAPSMMVACGLAMRRFDP